jgi:membrane-bound inhibitor of C-type lysozyme
MAAVIAVVVGCGARVLGQEPGAQPAAESPASSPASSTQNPITNPQPVPSSDVAARAVPHRVRYVCDNNVRVLVTYRGSSARVFYNNHLYAMNQVVSADGGRYSDGKLLWWNVGQGGCLAHADDDRSSASRQLAAHCHETGKASSGRAHGAEATAEPAQSAATLDDAASSTSLSPGSVTGTVSHRCRMAMPPAAVVDVQLQDISRADAFTPIIAEPEIDFGDRQVPIPGDLQIRSRKKVVRSTAMACAPRLWSPVLTHGHSSKSGLLLRQVVDIAPPQR